MGFRIKFEKEKCVGCFACHMACLDAHHDVTEEDAKSYRTIKEMIDKEGGFQYQYCPGCMHCGTCMDVCPSGAIYRDGDSGLILGEKKNCTGCGKCLSVCPVGVIRLDQNGKIEKCDGCIDRIRAGRNPACVSVCYLHAITIEKR